MSCGEDSRAHFWNEDHVSLVMAVIVALAADAYRDCRAPAAAIDDCESSPAIAGSAVSANTAASSRGFKPPGLTLNAASYLWRPPGGQSWAPS